MVSQSWLIDCPKMYKISGEVMKFIENSMENRRVELTATRKSLAGVKIQVEIFQRDVLSPSLFAIAMIPLSHVLRKCTGGYKRHKLQEKFHHLMYKDIKHFPQNEKELETLIQAVRIYSDDIWMEFCIEKCAMLIMKSGK